MNRTRILLLLLLLLALGVNSSKAQTDDNFTTLTGGFSIGLPTATDGVSGAGSGIRFVWRRAEAEYEIGFHERQGFSSAVRNGVLSVDEVVRRYFNRFSTGKLIYRKEISSAGKPGFEYKYETATANFLLRIFQAGDRVYSLQAEMPQKNPAPEEIVVRVFDSFRLLSEEFIKTETAKRIAAATPPALPQSPAVAKAKSDVEDRNLKGKVKSVLTETANFAANDSPLPKKPSLAEEFDERGNLVKSTEFDSYGEVSRIRVFGYVAGKRAARTGSLARESSPGGIVLNFPPGKVDDRFDESYVYKYLGGNLVEESTSLNNGFLISRTRYVYLKNKKETFYYDGGTKPFRRVVETLDENLNPVKLSIFEPEGGKYKALDPYEVRYDALDAQGNWTQRTISRFYGFGGEGSFSPVSVEYRTIIYY